MSKSFGGPNPLTPAERALILALNADGLSVAKIRQRLSDHGFRRGAEFIRDCLRASGHSPNFTTGGVYTRPPKAAAEALLHYQSCTFCHWRGPTTAYYDHWRTAHRTRAGLTHAEVRYRNG